MTKNAGTQMYLDGADGSGSMFKNFGQQCDTAPMEVIKEVEKIVVQTVEKI